jgi:hypothetical protein
MERAIHKEVGLLGSHWHRIMISAALASLLTLLLAACQSFNSPPANSLASVTITNRTVSQITAATEAVFAEHYFQGGPSGPGQLTFERPGNRMNNLAYADYFFDEKVTVRVTVTIQPVFGSQVLLSCNAWLVEDAGDAVFEDDHKVRKIRKWPYAKLLADIQKQMGE